MSEQESFHQYIRGLLLIGFGMLLFKLLMTGHIENFIAPKMRGFTYFTLIVSFALGVFQVWSHPKQQSCDCGHHHEEQTRFGKGLIYALFLFPIVSGFLFSNAALDGSVAAKRGVTLAGTTSSQQPAGGNDAVSSLLTDAEENPQLLPQTAPPGYYEKLEKKLLSQQHITVNDADYMSVMDVIGKDVMGFKGKGITFIGFVHREPDLDQNTIILARYGITCCTADASVLGMMATGQNVSSLEQGDWVQITGTLGDTIYIDTLLPIVSIQSVKKISAPETPYVYQQFQ